MQQDALCGHFVRCYTFQGLIEMGKVIKVKIPATTANMGPGFDCLGLCLDIWNSIEVEIGGSYFDILGEGEESLPRGESNLVYQSFSKVFEMCGRPTPECGFVCHNNIPLNRGLGSSSAAIVGGLLAANEICDSFLTQSQILELAVKIEGHPDNVCAALMGGFQIVVEDGGRWVSTPVSLTNDLAVILFIPDVSMNTQESRETLPELITRRDAVYNLGRVAMLINSFSGEDFTNLEISTKDRLHQPSRQIVFPGMKNIFNAALSVGALGVFLSGAGSTVLALAKDKDREFTIGYEMADAASKSGIEGSLRITKPSSLGAHLLYNC